MANLVLDIWLISDHMGNYFFCVKSCKRCCISLITGAPIGFCLQRIFAACDFFSFAAVSPVVCMASSVLSLFWFWVGLEVRLVMQLSPIPPTLISPLPSCRGGAKEVQTFMLSIVTLSLLAHFMGITRISKDLVVCAALMSLTVSVLKLAMDSLLVNVVMHPIDFEKLKPNVLLSGDINSAKSQIFKGNYFYAVQNFNVVFLLNSLTAGLGLEGISYSDFMNSFENPLTVLDHCNLAAKQRKYVDDLYLDTASNVKVERTNIFTLLSNCYGIPRPAIVSRSADAVHTRSTTLHSPFPHNSKKGGPSLFRVLCRSFALRDLCRVARVSPLRRALIYRNPVLLHQTMISLCSLIDYHAVQVSEDTINVVNIISSEHLFQIIFVWLFINIV